MYFTGVNPNFQTGLVFGGKVNSISINRKNLKSANRLLYEEKIKIKFPDIEHYLEGLDYYKLLYMLRTVFIAILKLYKTYHESKGMFKFTSIKSLLSYFSKIVNYVLEWPFPQKLVQFES